MVIDPLFPKIQTQLKTQLTTTYFVVKMGVDIVTVSRYLNEEANCLIGFTCMAAFLCLYRSAPSLLLLYFPLCVAGNVRYREYAVNMVVRCFL